MSHSGNLGSGIGAMIRRSIRASTHADAQQTGYKIVMSRLGIQPLAPNAIQTYSSFVCIYCGCPHTVPQTLLGCGTCTAVFFPSEAGRLSRRDRLVCPLCDTDQPFTELSFCCCRCRRMQQAPMRQEEQRFPRLPAWRFFGTSLAVIVIGLVMIAACLIRSRVVHDPHSVENLQFVAAFFGGLTLLFGTIALVLRLFSRGMPTALLLAHDGFGYIHSPDRVQRFAWSEVQNLEIARTLYLDPEDDAASEPDSLARRWKIHAGQESLVFDARFQKARAFAHQVRMHSPAVPIEDRPPKDRVRVAFGLWLGFLFALGVVIIALCTTQ